MKLQSNDKKMNKDLKKLIKDNGSTVSFIYYSQVAKKQIAQNILKNQRFITKYKNLDAQLQNTMFQYNISLRQAPSNGNNGANAKRHDGNGQDYGRHKRKIKNGGFSKSYEDISDIKIENGISKLNDSGWNGVLGRYR